MIRSFWVKSETKQDVKTNCFIRWMGFYLRMSVLIPYITTLDAVRIAYHVSVMSLACVSGWYMFYLKYNDLSVNTDALLHSVLVGHTLFVYIIYLRRRESLFFIAGCMQDRFKEISAELNLERYHDIWNKADGLSLTLMKLGSGSCLVMYFSYVVNATYHRKLLYPLWLPFSVDSSVTYFIPIILQLTIFCLYSFVHVSGCGFCIGGAHFIGASFQVLGQAFQDSCKFRKSKFSQNHLQRQTSRSLVEERIKWCVEAHVAILKLTKQYKAVYESIIVEVLISCEIIICFAAFQIVLALEKKDYVRAATVLTMVLLLMFHLFMFCYPGQHIYNKSEQFRDTLYFSQWQDQSLRVQKLINIMLLNTLKPMSISFRGSIIHASMSSFLNALRTAFSYVNILLILRGVR